jgi:hypothetical protein
MAALARLLIVVAASSAIALVLKLITLTRKAGLGLQIKRQ